MTVRIGFDIGGLMSKYPREVMPLFRACLASPEMEVYIVTDMSRSKALAMLALNEIPIAADRVHSCDYREHGEECKAKKAAEIGLDILVDDHPGYVATIGAPPLRLLSMPDPTRDYYHETWKTDGSEGDFGRRKKKGTK